MKRTFKTIAQSLIAATLALNTSMAFAQNWPSKPITLTVPLAPGGGGDIAARIVAAELSTALKQTVIVENKAGAGSVIGTQHVAKLAPDGYNLLLITDFHSINEAMARENMLPQPLPYDSIKDFAPIAQLVTLQTMLMANPKLGVTDMKSLVAKAKASKEAISAGVPGLNTPHNLAFMLLEEMADIEILKVPFQGSGPATLAMMGDQVNLAFAAIGPALQMKNDGRAVALAVAGNERDPLAPDTPTIAESGYPDFSVQSWMGIVAPAGTSPEIINRINTEITQILKKTEVINKLRNAGLNAAPGTSEEFRQVILDDIEKIQNIYKNQLKKKAD